MRVLVVSLLRIGDFLQIMPVLQGLKNQHPVDDLDLLTFEPVQQLAPMIHGINKWWTIDRDELQEGLGRADVPLLTSFSVLKDQLDRVSACEYDCVINLTQTHFSAWIAGYIKTKNRSGMVMDTKGQAHLHSPWFQYMDEHAPLEVADVFHYSDIFFYGSGLKGRERNWNLKETARGIKEVADLNLETGEKIVLQVLTSDAKKTWSEESWLNMLTELQLFRPKAQFVLLGSAAEADRLDSLFQKSNDRGLRTRKAILSLEGAFSLLKCSQLLISGDTSIKHMANACEIPVLELSMGSSDYRRTGTYKDNSLILQPVIECSPCPHSSPCRRDTHECALQLSPEAVSTSAHHFIDSNWAAIKELGKEYGREIRFLRTRTMTSGFWMACDVNETQPEFLIERMVERCTWKFFLNREYLNPVAQFGSEGINIKRTLEEIFPAKKLVMLGQHLGFLESKAVSLSEKAASLLETVRQRTPAVDEIKAFFTQHDPQIDALAWLEKIRAPSEGVVEIGGLRRVHSRLERTYQQSQVKMKLIRSLKTQLTETK